MAGMAAVGQVVEGSPTSLRASVQTRPQLVTVAEHAAHPWARLHILDLQVRSDSSAWSTSPPRALPHYPHGLCCGASLAALSHLWLTMTKSVAQNILEAPEQTGLREVKQVVVVVADLREASASVLLA